VKLRQRDAWHCHEALKLRNRAAISERQIDAVSQRIVAIKKRADDTGARYLAAHL
jgi:hypothetical protein